MPRLDGILRLPDGGYHSHSRRSGLYNRAHRGLVYTSYRYYWQGDTTCNMRQRGDPQRLARRGLGGTPKNGPEADVIDRIILCGEQGLTIEGELSCCQRQGAAEGVSSVVAQSLLQWAVGQEEARVRASVAALMARDRSAARWGAASPDSSPSRNKPAC